MKLDKNVNEKYEDFSKTLITHIKAILDKGFVDEDYFDIISAYENAKPYIKLLEKVEDIDDLIADIERNDY